MKAAERLNLSSTKFDEVYREAKGLTKSRLGKTASSHSRLLYFHSMLEILGMKSQVLFALDFEQTYWRNFLSNSVLNPGVLEFLQLAKNAGVTLVNITDLTAQIQFRKLIYFEIDTYFDFVVTSEEAGADKPDKSIFDLAINKSGVKPEDAWVIGDDASRDIVGGIAAGLVAIQFIGNKPSIGVTKKIDGCSIQTSSFEDLYKLLAAALE